MANPYYALRRIRKARRALPAPPEPTFEAHRDRYREILDAVHELAGEDAVDDVAGWVIVEAAHDGTLPSPRDVLHHARSVMVVYGVEPPEGSVLAT